MRLSNVLSEIVLIILAASVNLARANSDSTPAPPAPAWVSMVDQQSADARLAGYSTPKEVKLELVAENAVPSGAGQIAFKPDGTLVVLNGLPKPREPVKKPAFVGPPNSPNVATVFGNGPSYEDDICVFPGWVFNQKSRDGARLFQEDSVSAMLLDGNWIYTAGNATVRRRRRTRADGPFDVTEVVARGFGGHGPGRAYGLSIDPMGSLLIAVGSGDHQVVGSDGSRAQALDTGAVFRCRPDGSRMELLSLGLSTPNGAVVFDRDCNAFLAETDRGQTGSATRLLHITEGSDYGFRSLRKSRPELEDSARRRCLRDLPGVMNPLFSMPANLSGGMCIYNDSGFPPVFQGLLIYPDPASHSVKAFRLNRQDSSFAVSEAFDLVRSTDRTFTPWQVVIGPDGAIYVLDSLGRNTSNENQIAKKRDGRLFRLSWKGGPAHPDIPLKTISSWSKVASMNGAELIKNLAAPNCTDKQLAQRELIRRGKINQAALLTAVSNLELDTDSRALAAGALCTIWEEAIKSAFVTLATDDDAKLRRLAAEALGRNSEPKDPQIQETLLRILGDPDPATRRVVALAMAQVGAPEASDCIAGALSFDIGTDAGLRDGLVRALERSGKPGLEAIMKLANSGEEDRLDLAVSAFCALRSPAALELLPQLLVNPHMSITGRVRLIRSLARYSTVNPRDLASVLMCVAGKLEFDPLQWSAIAEVLQARAKGAGGFVRLYFALIPQ